MDTGWLIDFLTLAETGSFSRAAEQRNLTQPAFSRRIRALEDWIGAALFDRSIVPVALTEPGRRFVPEARRLVEGIETAQRVVRAAAQAGATSLSLVTTDLLAPGFTPMLLSLADESLGGGLVHVSVASPRAGEAMLMRGQCQLLLHHRHSAVADGAESPDLLQAVVAVDHLVAVGTPELAAPFDGDDPAGPVPLLAHEEDTLPGRIFAGTVALRLAHVRFDIVFVSQSAALLHAMALRGKGVAWLPFSLAREDILRGHLRAIGPSAWREPVDITLVRNRSAGSKALERLWEDAAFRETGRPFDLGVPDADQLSGICRPVLDGGRA